MVKKNISDYGKKFMLYLIFFLFDNYGCARVYYTKSSEFYYNFMFYLYHAILFNNKVYICKNIRARPFNIRNIFIFIDKRIYVFRNFANSHMGSFLHTHK